MGTIHKGETQEKENKEKMKLHLGCGKDYMEGYVNVDMDTKVKTDLVWNLNVYPYPFKDNTIEEVTSTMLFEHLNNPLRHLQELIRICKNGAYIYIDTCDYTNKAMYNDLTHRIFLSEEAFTQHNIPKELKIMVLWTEAVGFGKLMPLWLRKKMSLMFGGLKGKIHVVYEVEKKE